MLPGAATHNCHIPGCAVPFGSGTLTPTGDECVMMPNILPPGANKCCLSRSTVARAAPRDGAAEAGRPTDAERGVALSATLKRLPGVELLAATAVYVAAAELGLAMAYAAHLVSLVWPASGVALAL